MTGFEEFLVKMVPVLSGLVAGGAAWGAVKSGLNGTVKRVERIEAKIDALGESENSLGIGTSAMRAELDGAVERIGRVQHMVEGMLQTSVSMSVRLAHLEGACPQCERYRHPNVEGE